MAVEGGAADVADEQRVPGEHSDRAIGIGRVVQHKGKVIVRVSRSFKHPDFQLAYRELIAFARGLGRSEEHTSELQSLMRISYAVFCLKKKTQKSNKSYT